jgi:hypothetical protein
MARYWMGQQTVADVRYGNHKLRTARPAARLRQSAPRLPVSPRLCRTSAVGVNGKATRHSPTGDAGLASAEFRTDAPWLPASPRLCRTSATGCFTLHQKSGRSDR